ncbi:unnamed protein product [Heligmosomoides polygyrus]|uniref:Uncharacterized protein n=1 Tax=Heligmosomoides polygyrus TaxID=6339 RepID=A0A183F336_HELPZ|nr:unnamed protein product [Heligmosomoides polygyrus]
MRDKLCAKRPAHRRIRRQKVFHDFPQHQQLKKKALQQNPAVILMNSLPLLKKTLRGQPPGKSKTSRQRARRQARCLHCPPPPRRLIPTRAPSRPVLFLRQNQLPPVQLALIPTRAPNRPGLFL